MMQSASIALATFLPRFESPGFEFGRWVTLPSREVELHSKGVEKERRRP